MAFAAWVARDPVGTRRRLVAVVLLAGNLPWVILWWRFTDPGLPRDLGVPALFLLLTVATIGMVVVPLFIGGIRGRRWLLILALGGINLFWCLKWIERFATSPQGGSGYAAERLAVLRLMSISSLAVLLAYAVLDALLERHRADP